MVMTSTTLSTGASVASDADDVDPLMSWRLWTTRHPVGASLIAGAVGTHMATVLGLWFHGIGLPNLNWPATNGAVIFPKGSAVAQFWGGYVVHTLDGLVFGLLFALLVHAKLPLPNTSLGNIAKGILYGTVLAIISSGWMVPYVYAPHSGANLFSTGFGGKFVFAVFLWHWIFGFFLGVLYNPLPRRTSHLTTGHS
jgi:hypothetical protein